MINKQENEMNAKTAKEVARKYGISDLEKGFDNFIINNDKYKAHILMIGGYSAGKSALLNKYIGKKVLKENQGPETDIAAELYFSENERRVANFLDGTKKEIDFNEDINIDVVKNVEYYLNSENIKTQCDYIMVDTPGFDSGIEKHNKALMQYIDNGTVFLLIVDCEKGTISESTLNFVKEISRYSTDIAVIINKCDKKIPDEVEEIKEHIDDLLQTVSGRSFKITCTSIYDNDVETKIKNIIAGFNPQYLYDKNITSILKDKCKTLIKALNLIKSNANLDTYEIEEEISKRKVAKERLLEQKELQKNKYGKQLHNDVKARIMSKIESALLNNLEALADAYKGGVEMFQYKIVEIIRPIMIAEVEDYSSVAFDGFLDNLNYESLNISDNMAEIEGIIESVSGKIADLKNRGMLVRLDENNDNNDNGLKIYKTLGTAIAIATDVIAPPLEILIVFLPDIIKLIGYLTGNTKEQQLIDAIRNKIIPQIIGRIQIEIDKSLSEIEKVVFENISDEIDEILAIENNALEEALTKKKEAENDYSEYISAIDEDIEKINEIIGK